MNLIYRITYFPFNEAGTQCRFPRWFKRFSKRSVRSFLPFIRNTTIPVGSIKINAILRQLKTNGAILCACYRESVELVFRICYQLIQVPRTFVLVELPGGEKRVDGWVCVCGCAWVCVSVYARAWPEPNLLGINSIQTLTSRICFCKPFIP